VVVRRCNLTCGYCNEFDEESSPYYRSAEGSHRQAQELGTSAGVHRRRNHAAPDINELIAYARSKSFHKVMMISNAYC